MQLEQFQNEGAQKKGRSLWNASHILFNWMQQEQSNGWNERQ
jgi:hypothetical protein